MKKVANWLVILTKGLKKENLRDNMTNMELVLNMLAETSSTEISKSKKEKGFKEAQDSVIEGGNKLEGKVNSSGSKMHHFLYWQR